MNKNADLLKELHKGEIRPFIYENTAYCPYSNDKKDCLSSKKDNGTDCLYGDKSLGTITLLVDNVRIELLRCCHTDIVRLNPYDFTPIDSELIKT